ncbi:MAG: hypothetical protein AAF907_00025 [Planctomycetota bacterium]
MSLLIDFYQNRRISDAESRSDAAASKAQRARDEMHEMKQCLDRSALVCQALLELVQDRLGVTDDELAEKILEVDLRDGREDGRISNTVVDCHECGRKVNTGRPRCVFCGVAVRKPHRF